MRKIVLYVLASFALTLAGCGAKDALSKQDHDSSQNVKVVTTISQIGDIVKNVGGEYVNVKSLMGPGTDPHLYKAVHSDIQDMSEADMIFYNGHHLEGNMIDIFEQMREQKPTIPVAEAIPESKLLADPENPEIYDPHVWFDIELWKYAVKAVRDELIAIDPEHEEDYIQNTERYLQKLDELNAYAIKKVSEIPEKSRVLVTAHDAFSYFGNAFGFEVMGLQGLSTEAEFGLKDVQHLIDTLVERNIKAVFVESSISERSIHAVVEGAKKKGHNVSIGGELYSDAMGPEGTKEGTYIGMFKHNIDTIVEALK
ncbi:manganese/zinc/iron transport system substrate-binding protein [Melghiribacillus thermohalophilus]|uniref:Manganese/zinc/iron transport system substrate-binding protein n=1 Tax=Melghiribacillus thermohalophilus TaxID=1324956 RepID=A0A4R3N8S3_9BACI|nr:zinc ABC transporter substrate-binding protein [Melghiribacillus thermohalophilus]TCT23329.1 manganese/zinc/iron transport system substrate-binding protein [Melghiribacillus thermohalophilus]